jgi:hypothetical protein
MNKKPRLAPGLSPFALEARLNAGAAEARAHHAGEPEARARRRCQGKATALIVGVGGFLGMGEKDVAVPFNAVQVTNKNNNKWYLVMNASKDTLKTAKGFKYDRNAMTWVPEEQPATTGTQKPGNR